MIVYVANESDQQAAVESLLSRCNATPLIKNASVSHSTLQKALYAKHNNVNAAFKVVRGYADWYTTHMTHPSQRISIRDIESYCKLGFAAAPSQAKDTEGHPVLLFRFNKYRPGCVNQDTLIRGLVYFLESVTETEMASQQGVTMIGDLTDFAWANVDLRLYQSTLSILQNRFPIRIRNIILVRPPSFFSIVWSMVSSLFQTEMLNKVRIVRSLEELETFVTKENLPVDFGGCADYSPERFIAERYEKEYLKQLDSKK